MQVHIAVINDIRDRNDKSTIINTILIFILDKGNLS